MSPHIWVERGPNGKVYYVRKRTNEVTVEPGLLTHLISPFRRRPNRPSALNDPNFVAVPVGPNFRAVVAHQHQQARPQHPPPPPPPPPRNPNTNTMPPAINIINGQPFLAPGVSAIPQRVPMNPFQPMPFMQHPANAIAFPPGIPGMPPFPGMIQPARGQLKKNRHKCSSCGRSRSARYHHQHPIIPGLTPADSICRKCQRVETESESTDSDLQPPKSPNIKAKKSNIKITNVSVGGRQGGQLYDDEYVYDLSDSEDSYERSRRGRHRSLDREVVYRSASRRRRQMARESEPMMVADRGRVVHVFASSTDEESEPSRRPRRYV